MATANSWPVGSIHSLRQVLSDFHSLHRSSRGGSSFVRSDKGSKTLFSAEVRKKKITVNILMCPLGVGTKGKWQLYFKWLPSVIFRFLLCASRVLFSAHLYLKLLTANCPLLCFFHQVCSRLRHFVFSTLYLLSTRQSIVADRIFWLVFTGWVSLLTKFQALVSKPLLKGYSPVRGDVAKRQRGARFRRKRWQALAWRRGKKLQVAGSFCSLVMSLSQFRIPNYL